MSVEFTLRLPKYYRAYDGSDNLCCWLLSEIDDELQDILEMHRVDYNPMFEDWGTAYSWNESGTDCGFQIECVDADTSTYKILAWSYRKRWPFGRKSIDIAQTKLGKVLEDLQRMGQETSG